MEEADYPPEFRCPISMEVMKDPVTILTGVSYERKNIEKWFYGYNKKTCPATMQCLQSLDLTPNHTLKRLILAWQPQEKRVPRSSSPPPPSLKYGEMVSLLSTLASSPFKVTSLKKIRSIVELGEDSRSDFIRAGGVEVVVQVLVNQIHSVVDNSDFVSFQACEEALGILHRLPLSEEHEAFQLLLKPESMKSIALVLQRGTAEARLYAISIFRQIAKTDFDWNLLLEDQVIDLLKSLLELVYDQICSKASSSAMEVLIEILSSSKKTRVKAIEAGAVCVFVELLADSNKSKCEKLLFLIKLLCECAEGRMAMAEHGLGIPAVSKQLLHVSTSATKLSVKILWLMAAVHPTERVLKEMLMCGAVKKLVTLMHLEGRSLTKEKVVAMFKLHGNSWKSHPCFPCDLKDSP